MSEMVKKADEFVRDNAASVNKEYYPTFHCVQPIGWINDPNGFSYWRGQYHMFGQFYPYKPIWGPMHWGHWVSNDLVHWDWVSTAMAPDSPYDDCGCFSGTAAVDDEDNLVIMYTGVHKDANGNIVQEQCLAKCSDGVNVVKYEGNPVISSADLPAGSSFRDFRDPKLLRTENGWRAIVASRGEQNGRQLSFSSKDLIHWTCDGVFLEGIGDMPECPDYFDLDGKKCMITCVMKMPDYGLRFPSTMPVAYILGEEVDGRLQVETIEAADNGIEFYAPETVETTDGRRVMMAWLHMWHHNSPADYLNHGWCGLYTIPRELFVKNDHMFQQPLRELQQLRGECFGVKNVAVKGDMEIAGLNGRHYEMDITMTPDGNKPVEMRIMQTGDEYFSIRYEPETRVITCDRSKAGFTMGENGQPEAQPYSHAKVPGESRDIRLQIFVDTCSVEVFVNGGAIALSTLSYPKGSAQGISFNGEFTIDDLSKWELNAI